MTVLIALIVLQMPPAHTGTSSSPGADNPLPIVGLWRHYNPGTWESLTLFNTNRFEWTLHYRMGGERIRGHYRIADKNQLEIRVDEFERLNSDVPTPGIKPNDPLLFRFELDHQGNMKLECIGVHKRHPFNLTSFPIRTYTSTANFRKGVLELLDLLEEDHSNDGREHR